jgi:drug/metabolite transporter (DMT)-like permease
MSAIFAALRFGEKPSLGYWSAAVGGSLLLFAYAYLEGATGLMLGDLWLLLAILFAAVGYAEGGKLSSELGAINVISWALALTLPVNLLVTYLFYDLPLTQASDRALVSFLYVALISMYIGFFFWYRGLALGGVARVGQVQLLQPFATLIGAYFLLGEPLTLINGLFAIAVFAVVIAGRMMPIYRNS